jgi:DNA-binding transcriptional ArsR family regulator
MPDPSRLDPLIHAPVRLAIVSALAGVEAMSFVALRDATATTDGNLSAHLVKLEEAGYVAVDKSFVGRKPHTTARLTDAGRRAFVAYLDALAAFLPKG